MPEIDLAFPSWYSFKPLISSNWLEYLCESVPLLDNISYGYSTSLAVTCRPSDHLTPFLTTIVIVLFLLLIFRVAGPLLVKR